MEKRKNPIDLNDVLAFIEKYRNTSEPEIIKLLALQMITHTDDKILLAIQANNNRLKTKLGEPR